MDLLALRILPSTLLILSAALAIANRWTVYPGLGMLAAANVFRSAVYLAGWYSWNPSLSKISAVLMLLASIEAIQRARFRGWRLVFCAGLGVACASVSVLVGQSADPLKSASHVACGVALAVSIVVCLLVGRKPARLGLMLLYLMGAIASSKGCRPDEWWSIMTTEATHIAALSGFLWLAVSERLRVLPEPAP